MLPYYLTGKGRAKLAVNTNKKIRAKLSIIYAETLARQAVNLS